MLRALLATIAMVAVVLAGPSWAQDADTAKQIESCRAIADSAARLKCFEDATSRLESGTRSAPAPSSPVAPPASVAPRVAPSAIAPSRAPAPPTVPPQSMGGWRLVRIANPAGDTQAVSITHTIDLTTSDLDLAGLVIRCGPGAPEVLVSLITPFPPQARPKVAVGAPNQEVSFSATVVSPGTLLLLPTEVAALVNGSWQSLPELKIEISGEGKTIRGAVPIEGLAAALPTLAANCPAR